MPLTEDEEFELLSLEREKSQIQEPKKPGMLSQLGSAFRSAADQAINTPMGAVSEMSGTIDKLAQMGGDLATRHFQDQGFNAAPLMSPSQPLPVSPGAAKLFGKSIEYGPTAVSLLATPIDTSKTAVKAAVPAARRALGFQKSMLKTPFARGQATKAAETALEEGIIPASGNTQTMFQRASEMGSKAGQSIGESLKKTPANLKKAFDDLEVLRPQLAQGMQGGLFEGVNNAINKVQENILELAKKPNAMAGSLNAIKTRLGQSLNYFGDIASQIDNKAIQNTLANSIRNMVKGVLPPEEFVGFLNKQKLYNASELMLKGLNNELAGQAGNAAISLPSMVAGAGRIAAGDIPGTAAVLGLGEGLKRRGMGMAANAIQGVGKAAPAIGVSSAIAASKPVLKQRTLTKQKAAEFLDEANGDKVKARELAKAAGYKF